MSSEILDMTSEGAPGFFGKVPVVGDFVSRRLPRDFIDPWDQWLQAAIVSSREQLAEDWLDNYLGSPIWRFALSAEVAGSFPCSGILMPSVDKAGRYFPFTLATLLPANFNIFHVACTPQEWYVAAEEVALSVLEETPPDMEILDQQVIALGPLAANAVNESDSSTPMTEEEVVKPWHFPIPSVSELADSMPELVKQMMELRFDAYSLWWTSGSEEIEPAMLMCEGLPPVSGYAAMLGGGWKGYGWSERAVIASAIAHNSEASVNPLP